MTRSTRQLSWPSTYVFTLFNK